MSVTILPGSNIEENVLLSDLIDLDEAGIEDGCMPMRDVDSEHVSTLALLPASELPAIKTVKIHHNGMVKHVVIDGYHRWYAAVERKETTIRAIAGNYQSEYDIITAAFEANLKHGLKASKQTRTDYALWLYWNDTDNKLSMRAIARKVGLNESSVSRAIKRAEQESENEEERAARAEQDATKKLFNALHNFYGERSLFSMLNGSSQRNVQYRAKLLHAHIASQPKEKRGELVQEIASLNETLDAFLSMTNTNKTSA
jgi:predicted DNA-binding protein YlxM (UPF0122 family)